MPAGLMSANRVTALFSGACWNRQSKSPTIFLIWIVLTVFIKILYRNLPAALETEAGVGSSAITGRADSPLSRFPSAGPENAPPRCGQALLSARQNQTGINRQRAGISSSFWRRFPSRRSLYNPAWPPDGSRDFPAYTSG